jgi:DNA-binding response OmpR family regulator
MSEMLKFRDKILAVDDTPETLGLLTEALEKAGLTILVARDGETALGLLDEITPDLVLMDAVMPGLGGFETCRRLKQAPHSSHLPVIFMTGLSETEHVIEGLAAGGVDYITKPFVIDELLARIRVHLANARVIFRTRTALDSTGRCLLATDETGQIVWCTPHAGHLLAAKLSDGTRLAPEIVERLNSLRHETGTGAKCITLDIGTRRLECVYLSRAGPNEFLFRLTETNPAEGAEVLKEALTLTAREAEVLVWLAAGKSNRDISGILGISPRTVNKHLEQIFAKLGVENRAAAAVIAVRALSARL